MSKTRVPKGEKYWFINENFDIEYDYEQYSICDDRRFDLDNYFITEEKAQVVAKKLRAVLKGADVIEMPSEEEYEKIIPQRIGCSDEFAAGEGNGYWHGYNYLKSKIVK